MLLKIPSRPGGGHGKPLSFTFASGGWGYPPDPHFRTGMEDRLGTVTDASQSTTFRLCSSAAAPVTGAAAPRHPLPRCALFAKKPGCRKSHVFLRYG